MLYAYYLYYDINKVVINCDKLCPYTVKMTEDFIWVLLIIYLDLVCSLYV